jgi:hypothetical protein
MDQYLVIDALRFHPEALGAVGPETGDGADYPFVGNPHPAQRQAGRGMVTTVTPAGSDTTARQGQGGYGLQQGASGGHAIGSSINFYEAYRSYCPVVKLNPLRLFRTMVSLSGLSIRLSLLPAVAAVGIMSSLVHGCLFLVIDTVPDGTVQGYGVPPMRREPVPPNRYCAARAI